MRAGPSLRWPSIALVVGGLVVLAGFIIGLRPLGDNSFFTHLATGRLILGHGIPRTDPFSFTAHGHRWVVQSWLAAGLYGLVDRAGGGHGLVLLHASQTGLLAAIGWRLVRPAATLGGRLLAIVPFLVLGTVLWAPRPLLLGLILFAVVIVVAEEERLSPWWLLPVGWLWVNIHGSFPFAILYLVVRLAGSRLDRRPPERPLRLVAVAVAGVLLGALNPLGPRLLGFPLHVLSQHRVLSQIIEWMSPDFSLPTNMAFLAQLLVALLLLSRRKSWEDGLVAVVFGFLGVLALRNSVVASLALTPVLAKGLGGLGRLTGDRAGPLAGVALGALLVAGMALAVGSLSRPAYALGGLPVRELDWMGRQGLLRGRVLTTDIVGNLRTLREGRRARVFIDDRYDMYPRRVALDYLDLYFGLPDALGILDRYRVDAVLWGSHRPLAGILVLDGRWRVVRSGAHWMVAVRAPA